MMVKSIRAKGTEILLDLVKDGDFDESTLFRQTKKGNDPVVPTSSAVPTSSK